LPVRHYFLIGAGFEGIPFAQNRGANDFVISFTISASPGNPLLPSGESARTPRRVFCNRTNLLLVDFEPSPRQR